MIQYSPGALPGVHRKEILRPGLSANPYWKVYFQGSKPEAKRSEAKKDKKQMQNDFPALAMACLQIWERISLLTPISLPFTHGQRSLVRELTFLNFWVVSLTLSSANREARLHELRVLYTSLEMVGGARDWACSWLVPIESFTSAVAETEQGIKGQGTVGAEVIWGHIRHEH